jgi:hypothetical protein
MRRITTTLGLAAALLLATAVPVLAHDNGQGLLGETTDRMVTFISLGVLIFLVAFVVIMSLIQHQLEKRHDHSQPAPKAGW